MIFDPHERPGMASIVVLALIGLPLLVVASWLEHNYPGYDLPYALLDLVGLIISAAAGALAIWLSIALALGWFEWANEIRTTTARLKEMQQAERLSEEQLAIIPRLEYGANIAIHMDPKNREQRRFFLMTAGGMVPWDFCQAFLLDCGVTTLKPIKQYSEGTQGYDHARWFTGWLRDNAFALGGDGSRAGQAAQWMTEQSKAEVCILFDVSLELSNLDLRKHYTEENPA